MGKKLLNKGLFLVFCLCVNIVICQYMKPIKNVNFTFSGRVEGTGKYEIQVFLGEDMQFAEEQSVVFEKQEGTNVVDIKCNVPSSAKYLRIDFGMEDNAFTISDMKMMLDGQYISEEISEQLVLMQNHIERIEFEQEMLRVETKSGDPFIILDLSGWELEKNAKQKQKTLNLWYDIIACVYLDVLLIFLWSLKKKLNEAIRVFVQNATLIRDLAINDFKTKFVGAVFGTVWAFIQPVVTILVYWFVFQVGLRSGNSGDTQVPYALWLSTGIIPWFFFSEAWSSATNSLIEYSYLVKKVIFNVSIIPGVKIISALFIHAFFVVLLLAIYVINGINPAMYWLQVIYYSFATLILVLALSYITSALVVFFRDISQIIAVILQIGVWLTPIMWELEMIPSRLQWIFKLNPMYYIVCGYRQALIYREWAWNNVISNIYFWTFTLLLLVLGHNIFKKLKPHFADVL